MKQSKQIQQLTDKELRLNLFLSQLIFILLAFSLSLFFFDELSDWINLFYWDVRAILLLGIIPGILIVVIDLILMYILPKSAFDDGGINERIFKNASVPVIFGIALLVAIAEELLFRGVIQTTFGYVFASILFAIVHVRYLRKPVLFTGVVIISLLIGYIFLVTNNLFITITLHFVVDFMLGLYIRFKSEVFSH